MLAIPLLDIDLGFPDASTNPEDFHTRQAYDLLTEGFGEGFSSPLILVVEDTSGIQDETIAQLSDAVGAMDGVVQVDQPFVNDAGDTAVITVIPATSANDNATQDLVTDLRDSTIPAGARRLDRAGLRRWTDGKLPGLLRPHAGTHTICLPGDHRSQLPAADNRLPIAGDRAQGSGDERPVDWGGIWRGHCRLPVGMGSELLRHPGEQPIAVFMPMFLFAILFGLRWTMKSSC